MTTRRDDVIQLRVSTEEKGRIEDEAKSWGTNVSTFLRSIALNRHGDTGLVDLIDAEKASEEPQEVPAPTSARRKDPPQEPSERLYRCSRHPDVERKSPNAPCSRCGRKTNEPVP